MDEQKRLAVEQLERVSKILASIGETVDYTELAIKALEQEPCEDCISREEALECFPVKPGFGFIGSHYNVETIRHQLINCPSVQPIAKWIPVSERLPKEVNNYLTSIRHYGKERFVQVSFFDGISFKAEVEAWMPLPEPFTESEE